MAFFFPGSSLGVVHLNDRAGSWTLSFNLNPYLTLGGPRHLALVWRVRRKGRGRHGGLTSLL